MSPSQRTHRAVQAWRRLPEWLRTLAVLLFSVLVVIVVGTLAISFVVFEASHIRVAGGTRQTAWTADALEAQPAPAESNPGDRETSCPSRVAGNIVLVSCKGQPTRAAHLAGVRTRTTATLQSEIEPFLAPVPAPVTPAAPSQQGERKQVEPVAGVRSEPQLMCAWYRVSIRATSKAGDALPAPEALAFCRAGDVQDIAVPLLLSGHAALTPASSLSRLFLEKKKRLAEYTAAQNAARQERTGLWWDRTDGQDQDADPIAWRATRDAQVANDPSVTTATQAWIASLLVFGGAAAGFLYEFNRNRYRDSVTRRRRLNWVRGCVGVVKKAAGNGQRQVADAAARRLREWLQQQGASYSLLGDWDSVINAVAQGSDSYKDSLDKFLMDVENEPLLDGGTNETERVS